MFSQGIVLNSYEEIVTAHKLLNYDWRSLAVPRIIIEEFPEEIKDLEPVERVRFFIKAFLPLILIENERILEEKNKVKDLFSKDELTGNEKNYLTETLYKYRIINEGYDISDITEDEKSRILILVNKRILPIPPPIALSMAALESGWGTSRFVFEGNNLFGHVAINPQEGIQPANWSGKKRNIQIFDSVSESISVYMLNLNRNRAYRRFRVARARNPYNLFNMTKGFYLYSIIRDEYAVRLQFIISRYDFARFNDAYLDNEERIVPLLKLKQMHIH